MFGSNNLAATTPSSFLSSQSVYGHIDSLVPNTAGHSIDLPQSLLLPVNQHKHATTHNDTNPRLANRNKAHNSRHSPNAIMPVSFGNHVSR
ncbi:hypothetical protein T265_07593 [Opisthorchis viverrini]|uniref:Uncharacterized protein n=1 Tax=Opisthorchis viverrini TaxID=6198 RepID=A0A074ZBX5_OPIVI|nr:hypothetical protein T265_07593 [Opisthorchis viverrini]KER24806.1 hypothetical protein T265_07593 [Opisthorchis viverrini]